MLSRVVVLACLLAGGCDRVFGLDDRDASVDNVDARSMRIKYVQSQSAFQDGVDSLTVAFTEPVLLGDLVVVAVASYRGQLQSLTDTAHNVYREPNGQTPTALAATLHVLYASNVEAASPFAVTLTMVPGGNYLTMAIHAYRGADADPLDQHQVGVGLDMAATSGTAETTRDGELWFGALTHDDTLVTTVGSGFSRREAPTESGAHVPLVTEDMIGPGQTAAATFQMSTPDTWACELITFK